MRYFKQLNESGEVILLLEYGFDPVIDDPMIVEINKEEYDQIAAEIEANNAPPEADPDEISDSEALAIILGGDPDETF